MDKYFMWIHYERLHNLNKAKHNKTVCIFLGIYCSRVVCPQLCPADSLSHQDWLRQVQDPKLIIDVSVDVMAPADTVQIDTVFAKYEIKNVLNSTLQQICTSNS